MKVKDSYLAQVYHRLAGRRGVKKAILAVAHRILRASDLAMDYQLGRRLQEAQRWVSCAPTRPLEYVYPRTLRATTCGNGLRLKLASLPFHQTPISSRYPPTMAVNSVETVERLMGWGQRSYRNPNRELEKEDSRLREVGDKGKGNA